MQGEEKRSPANGFTVLLVRKKRRASAEKRLMIATTDGSVIEREIDTVRVVVEGTADDFRPVGGPAAAAAAAPPTLPDAPQIDTVEAPSLNVPDGSLPAQREVTYQGPLVHEIPKLPVWRTRPDNRGTLFLQVHCLLLHTSTMLGNVGSAKGQDIAGATVQVLHPLPSQGEMNGRMTTMKMSGKINVVGTRTRRGPWI